MYVKQFFCTLYHDENGTLELSTQNFVCW